MKEGRDRERQRERETETERDRGTRTCTKASQALNELSGFCPAASNHLEGEAELKYLRQNDCEMSGKQAWNHCVAKRLFAE